MAFGDLVKKLYESVSEGRDDSDVLLGQEQKIVAALKAQGCPLSKEEILDRIGDLTDDAAEMLNDAFQSGNQARIKKELEWIWKSEEHSARSDTARTKTLGTSDDRPARSDGGRMGTLGTSND